MNENNKPNYKKLAELIQEWVNENKINVHYSVGPADAMLVTVFPELTESAYIIKMAKEEVPDGFGRKSRTLRRQLYEQD